MDTYVAKHFNKLNQIFTFKAYSDSIQQCINMQSRCLEGENTWTEH